MALWLVKTASMSLTVNQKTRSKDSCKARACYAERPRIQDVVTAIASQFADNANANEQTDMLIRHSARAIYDPAVSSTSSIRNLQLENPWVRQEQETVVHAEQMMPIPCEQLELIRYHFEGLVVHALPQPWCHDGSHCCELVRSGQ